MTVNSGMNVCSRMTVRKMTVYSGMTVCSGMTVRKVTVYSGMTVSEIWLLTQGWLYKKCECLLSGGWDRKMAVHWCLTLSEKWGITLGWLFQTDYYLVRYDCIRFVFTVMFTGQHYLRQIRELTLEDCHSMRIEKFCAFLTFLPELRYLTLRAIFKEPPLGCSRYETYRWMGIQDLGVEFNFSQDFTLFNFVYFIYCFCSLNDWLHWRENNV